MSTGEISRMTPVIDFWEVGYDVDGSTWTSPIDGYCPLKFRAPASVQGAPAGRKEWFLNDSQMLSWMHRPTSVIGGKADMALTLDNVR
jgi:hypothetical protein